MLSVIICTYNRDKYIYNVLKSIGTNHFPHNRYEIILIDNNCTDNTSAECDRFRKDFPDIPFFYIIEKKQGLSHARNKGIETAHGNILIYVDDDATVNNEYLQTYADFFQKHSEIIAAGGPILPVYETREPTWFSPFTKSLITGYLYYGKQEKPFKNGKYPGGGNVAYRKEVFANVGMFNPNLGRNGENLTGAEEKDIFNKMRQNGMNFFYLPKAILYHIIPEKKLTADYFKKLTYSIGKSERIRTRNTSFTQYLKRLISEAVKWAASIVLCIGYTLCLQPTKGYKLILFRWNVTKGLLALPGGTSH